MQQAKAWHQLSRRVVVPGRPPLEAKGAPSKYCEYAVPNASLTQSCKSDRKLAMWAAHRNTLSYQSHPSVPFLRTHDPFFFTKYVDPFSLCLTKATHLRISIAFPMASSMDRPC